MSFILDALRRADAQREHQTGGGLHAQAIPLPDDEPAAPRWRTRWLALGGTVVAGGVVAAGVLMWQWPAQRPVAPTKLASAAVPAGAADAVLPPPRQPLVRTSETQAPATRSSRRMPPEAASEAPVGPAEPAVGADAVAPPPSPARTMPLPAGVPPAAAGSPQAPAQAQPQAQPQAPQQALPQAPPPPATAAARSSALPPGAPRVVVSGGVYSQSAASRMVIINGQVFGEGTEPVAGVTVEQIQPNRAVLRYQGQRYTVTY
jgi:general secretion pathway protein B